MHAKYQVATFNIAKVMKKVKVLVKVLGHTDTNNDRQAKNNITPIIQSRAKKNIRK